jgi:hypothetical protein
MTIPTRTLLSLFLLDAGALLLATPLWKEKDTELSSFFWAGSYIYYRDLPKYIREERTRA